MEEPPQTTQFSKFEMQARRKCTWYFCHTFLYHWFGEFYVYFDEEGCWSHPFPHKSWNCQQQQDRKIIRLTFKPIQLNGNQSLFDQLFTKPSLSLMTGRLVWRASQAWGERALVEKHIFLNRRRRSEQGNYTQAIFNYIIYLYSKGHLRGLTEQSLVTLG